MPNCSRCGGKVRIPSGALGLKIVCTRCGKEFTIARKGTTAAVVEPGYSYELEPPIERPPVEPPGIMQAVGQRDIQAAPLPDPPEWTFFSGVFDFPWRTSTLGHWAVLAVALGICEAASYTFGAAVGVFGQANQLDAVGAGMIAMSTIWLIVLTAAYASACCLAVAQDTSDGFDDVQNWPDADWREGFFSLRFPIYALVLAFLIGWSIEKFLLPGDWITASAAIFVTLPIFLLSALETDSVLSPFSLPILRTLASLWWGWLLFYLLSAPTLGVWIAFTALGVLYVEPYSATLLGGPLLAAVLLIYARLLGRLAWRGAKVAAE